MGSKGTHAVGGNGKNLIKLLQAIDQLSRCGGTTIKELQERLGVSRRSVYRMFDVLESLHFPLLDDDSPGEKEKRWRLQEDFLHRMPNIRIPDMKLTSRELLVLLFSASAGPGPRQHHPGESGTLHTTQGFGDYANGVSHTVGVGKARCTFCLGKSASRFVRRDGGDYRRAAASGA